MAHFLIILVQSLLSSGAHCPPKRSGGGVAVLNLLKVLKLSPDGWPVNAHWRYRGTTFYLCLLLAECQLKKCDKQMNFIVRVRESSLLLNVPFVQDAGLLINAYTCKWCSSAGFVYFSNTKP